MRRRTVSFAPAAVDDLDAIFDWVAQASSAPAALAFVERIERYCLGFDLASERGRLIENSRDGLRYVGCNKQATIFFRVGDETVTIARIVRAGFDWQPSDFD